MTGSIGWSTRGMLSRMVQMPAESGHREHFGVGILF